VSRGVYQVTVARYDNDGAQVEVDSIVIAEADLQAARDWTLVVLNKVSAMFRLLGMGAD
jgi:hypothetical protein